MTTYSPGDKIRVLVDEAHNAPVHAGQILTVIEVGTATEADDSTVDVVIVSTDQGNFYLPFDCIEPASLAYTPAEPDEIVDAQFRALLAADPELLTLATDADTSLGAVEPEVGEQLAAGGPRNDGRVGGFGESGPDDVITAVDFAGDEMVIHYAEQACEEHGREGAFFFSINDSEDVVIPVEYMRPLIAFFLNRIKHSRRDDSS